MTVAGAPVHEGAVAELRAAGRIRRRPEPDPSTSAPAAAARQRPEVLSRDTQPRTEAGARLVLRATQARRARARPRAASTAARSARRRRLSTGSYLLNYLLT